MDHVTSIEVGPCQLASFYMWTHDAIYLVDHSLKLKPNLLITNSKFLINKSF